MKTITYLLFAGAVLLSSCAGTYTQINPSNLKYDSETSSGIITGIRQDALGIGGANKKYTKKSAKKGISVVAVKIVNTSNKPLTFGEDIKLYSGNREVMLLQPEVIHSELKQGVAIYLLYMPLTFLNLYTTNSRGQTTSTPIGLAIGPGLTLGNMLGAGGANNNFKQNLIDNNLINQVIEPGETKYGLIGLRNNDMGMLSFRVSPETGVSVE
jgi:hypothetical protein